MDVEDPPPPAVGSLCIFHFVCSVHLSIIKLTGIFNVFVQCLEICGSRAFQVEMFIMTMHQ